MEQDPSKPRAGADVIHKSGHDSNQYIVNTHTNITNSSFVYKSETEKSRFVVVIVSHDDDHVVAFSQLLGCFAQREHQGVHFLLFYVTLITQKLTSRPWQCSWGEGRRECWGAHLPKQW